MNAENGVYPDAGWSQSVNPNATGRPLASEVRIHHRRHEQYGRMD